MVIVGSVTVYVDEHETVSIGSVAYTVSPADDTAATAANMRAVCRVDGIVTGCKQWWKWQRYLVLVFKSGCEAGRTGRLIKDTGAC